MVRTTAPPYPFVERPWAEISTWFHGLAAEHASFGHMADIVDSVIAAGATQTLAACTSMHDLLVVPRPIPDPPYDVLRVRAPSSMRHVRAGHVVIEHETVTGHDDRIERPVAEAVRLFWRFVIEKYGIVPNYPIARSDAAVRPSGS